MPKGPSGIGSPKAPWCLMIFPGSCHWSCLYFLCSGGVGGRSDQVRASCRRKHSGMHGASMNTHVPNPLQNASCSPESRLEALAPTKEA